MVDEVRMAVRASGKTYEQIAAESGLSSWWIAKFTQGKIENPGIENFMRLKNILKLAA